MRKLRRTVSGHFHYILFTLFILVYLLRLHDVCSTYNRYNKVINEDAFGYYTILPALLKYQDPDFRFLDTSVKKLEAYREYIPPVVNHAPNGEAVSKYYSGVALLQLPFYLAGDVLASLKGASTGYESTYHFAILFSVIFYLTLAFLQLLKVFIRLGLPPITAAFILPLILFGTNLYAYTTFDMAYSHVYSFFTLVFFVHFLLQIKTGLTWTNALACGLFYGLIILIRPLNGISILFVPVVFSLKEFRVLFRSTNLVKTMCMGLSTLAMLSIQSMLWYWQTGLFYVYPYGSEKLYLNNPRIMELVFGFDSGWALYTPLPFLIIVSALLMLLWQKKIRRFAWAALGLSSLLYVLSCWYYLHYGCTIGCRPITEFYGPMFVLFVTVFAPLLQRKWFKTFFFGAASLLLFYNQVIHYQFYENIMNPCQMDKDKFKMVFMKTHHAYKYSTYPDWDLSGYGSGTEIRGGEVNTVLSTNETKQVDTLSVCLPAMPLNDSTLQLTLTFRCRMHNTINESFIRMYLSDQGKYIDLHHFLLRRKVNQVDYFQEITYDLLISKPLVNARMEFALESAGGLSITDVGITRIRIKRIHR